MKKYFLYLLLAMVACASQVQAQILITGFGSSEVNPFNTGTNPDGDFISPWTGTQTDMSLVVDGVTNGPSGGIAATLETPINIAGAMADLELTGALSGTPPVTSNFQIVLYDSSFNSLSYNFNWSDFSGGTQTIEASLFATSGVFNGTVSAYALKLFGGAGDTVSFTFNDLESIPEPATYALLGLGLLGLGLYRRQKCSLVVRAR